MNEEAVNTNPTQNQPPRLSAIKSSFGKIGQILSPFLLKFKETRIYKDKKIFYPVVGIFGLLFLIIILGLLFGGGKGARVVKPTPTPTPIVGQIKETPVPAGDILSQIEQRLQNLKSQIDGLDVKQSRLQPPAINFKINF